MDPVRVSIGSIWIQFAYKLEIPLKGRSLHCGRSTPAIWCCRQQGPGSSFVQFHILYEFKDTHVGIHQSLSAIQCHMQRGHGSRFDHFEIYI